MPSFALDSFFFFAVFPCALRPFALVFESVSKFSDDPVGVDVSSFEEISICSDVPPETFLPLGGLLCGISSFPLAGESGKGISALVGRVLDLALTLPLLLAFFAEIFLSLFAVPGLDFAAAVRVFDEGVSVGCSNPGLFPVSFDEKRVFAVRFCFSKSPELSPRLREVAVALLLIFAFVALLILCLLV